MKYVHKIENLFTETTHRLQNRVGSRVTKKELGDWENINKSELATATK